MNENPSRRNPFLIRSSFLFTWREGIQDDDRRNPFLIRSSFLYSMDYTAKTVKVAIPF